MIPFQEFSSATRTDQFKPCINDEELSMFDVFEQYISILEGDTDQNGERMVPDCHEYCEDSDDTMQIAQQRVTNNINLYASQPTRKPRSSNPDQKQHRRLTVSLFFFVSSFIFFSVEKRIVVMQGNRDYVKVSLSILYKRH
jgi:hypothetical protein